MAHSGDLSFDDMANKYGAINYRANKYGVINYRAINYRARLAGGKILLI
jgi:hypothetical protein